MKELNLIEKTRQHLIAQHGDNTVEKVNGFTMRKINDYLTNFDLFQENFENYLKFLNISYPSQEILAPLYKFFEIAEAGDIKDVANALLRKQKNSKDRGRKKLIDEISLLFKDLNEINKKPNVNYYTVKFILENDLNIHYNSNKQKDSRIKCTFHKKVLVDG